MPKQPRSPWSSTPTDQIQTIYRGMKTTLLGVQAKVVDFDDYGQFKLVMWRLEEWPSMTKPANEPQRPQGGVWRVETWPTAPLGIAMLKYFVTRAQARAEFDRLKQKLPHLLAAHQFGINVNEGEAP
jgi:hypothetical protein